MKRSLRRIVSLLCVLALCIGLLPATALAQPEELVNLTYESDGFVNDKKINVKVFVNDDLVQTIEVTDAKTASNHIGLSVVGTAYEIDYVESDAQGAFVSEKIQHDLKTYSFTYSFGTAPLEIAVYLRSILPKPEVEGTVYDGGATVDFRVYAPQVLKMLYSAGVVVNESTVIENVTINFLQKLGSHELNYINIENDYWNCSERSNINGWAVPYNVGSLTIHYKTHENGNTETKEIEADALRFVRQGSADPRYDIEAKDQNTHIVFFYNETDGNAGRNYFLYAIRFVKDGMALGETMPAEPQYDNSLYEFLNWEQGSYDGTGASFTRNTPVTKDLTVFARKISTEAGGTEIHVSNEYNQLFNRVAELYNANTTDGTSITANSIIKDSVAIVVADSDGEMTDKNGAGDRWMFTSPDWYLIYSTQGFDHISFNKISYITVYFEAEGISGEKAITIPVGADAGDISVRQSLVDHIVDLVINPAPAKPDADDLTILASGAVKVDCVSLADHGDKTYELLDGSYSVGEVTWTGTADGGHYTSAVTVNSEKYVAQYNTDDGVDVTHTLKGGESDTATITLKLTGSTWTVDGTQPVTFQVICDDEPVPPAKVAYTVEYYYDGVRNDAYTYTGTGEAGDIISQYPPRSVAGYAVDYTEGLPLTLAVGGANTIKVYYAKDANGDKIPDSKQVFIKYVSSDTSLGTVYPTEQVKTFENGVAEDITLNSTATAKDNAEFVSWTDETSSPISDSAAIKYTLKFPELGETYTYTANFKEKEPVPPAKVAYTVEYYYDGVRNDAYTYTGTGEAGDIISQYPPRSVAGYAVDYTEGLPLTLAVGGANTIKVYYAKDANDDEIPDRKQVFIKYVSSDKSLGTVNPTEQVETFANGVAEDITLNSTATPKDNAEFVSWMNETSFPISDSAAIKYTLKSPELGKTYTFTAYFKEKEPVPPAKVAYTVEYYYDGVRNDAYTYTGTGEAGDIISQYPPRSVAGYAVDYTVGLPLTLAVGGANTIKVYYATDKIGGTDPTDPGYPGDGIPDKYQVTIYYTASTGGYITGPTSEVLTIYNGTSYAAVGTVTATGSSAASYWDYSFVNWTNNAGAPVFYTYAFGPVAISNAMGGQTYTFTANFTWSWYPVNPPVIPNPPVDNGPEDLNTEEHVAYIVGFEDGTIRPEANITRAEVATIFFRLLTSEARAQYWSQTNAFTDVSSGDWYNNAVSTLANMGILGGYSDGTFRPSQPITRSEFVKIAVSFFKYADSYAYDGRFTDVEGDEWYVSFLAAAVNFGLIEGMPDGTFQPEAYISRAEACTIVNRTLGRAPHKDYLLPLADMLTWPDNTNRNAWYYEAMQEATNSHDYTWITVNGEKVESWTAKLAERNWAALEQQWSNAYSAAGSEVIK